MTEKSGHEAILAALAKLEERHIARGDEIKAYVAERLEATDKRFEVRDNAIVSRDAKLNEYGAAQVEIQRQMNTLREALEALELAKRDGASDGGKVDPRNLSVAKAFVAAAAYMKFADDPEMMPGVKAVDVGSVWSRERRSRRHELATRADNDFDGTTNPDLVKPDFRDEIVLFPKDQPILRSLSTVLTTDSDTVEIDRELVEYPWVASTTKAEIATATSLTLDSVEGLGTAAPYNILTVHNSAGPEDVTISAIDAETKIVTISALDDAVAIGDRVTSAYFLCTPEGALKPHSLDITEAVTYKVCKLASLVTASDEILTDSNRAQQLIDNRLLSRQARMEDKAGFYGPGGSKDPLGIFNDTDVPTFNMTAATETGTTRLEFIIDVYYEGIKQNYIFNAVILHPDDHKLVARSQDDEGAYIFPLAPMEGAPMRVFSMALLMSNQLEKVPADIGGDFVMGDFMRGITFYDRQNDTLDVGFVNDDFAKDRRTMRMVRRFAFAIPEPLALAKGAFKATPASA